MHNFNDKKAQKGLTLIELLIALILGVVVLLSVSQGLVTLNGSSRTQSNNALLQDTGDTALSYVAFEMRSALSTPCDRFSSLNDNAGRLNIKPLTGDINAENISASMATALADQISGVGLTVAQDDVGTIGDKSNVKTDNLTLVSTGQRLFTNSEVTYNSTDVSVKGQYPDAVNDTETIYAITDCKYMDVFRASPSVSGGNTTLTFQKGTDIERKYGINDPSMVAPLNVTEIMINSDGNLISKPRYGTSSVALLNNVEVMRVLFAVDTDGNDAPDSYVTASQVATLPSGNRIISADVYLMVRLPNLDTAWQNEYKLTLPKTDEAIDTSNGKPKTQEFTFKDRVPRKIFVRSVAIRNNSQML